VDVVAEFFITNASSLMDQGCGSRRCTQIHFQDALMFML